MTIVMKNIWTIVGSVEFFIGFLVNAFIGLVNFIDWANPGRVSTLNFIITDLAISRIILLTITSVIIVLAFNLIESFGNELRFLNSLWYFCGLSSAWFDASLNVFLFLKIANFFHPVFLWLKRRVDKVIFRMLIGCLIISLLICLPLTEIIFSIYFDSTNKGNMTGKIQDCGTYCFYSKIIFCTADLLPCILCLLSCFLLVLSLWRHTQQIQVHFTNYRDPSTEAHIKAMKFMVSSIFLFLLYYMVNIIALLSTSKFSNNLGITLALVIMDIYPMAHSIMLILGNSKLKQASLKVLQKLKECLRNSN
ncbi:LOW QUALITY PROTEIN: taste receptor type 2 member 7-like [Sarcophilus harrisii]